MNMNDATKLNTIYFYLTKGCNLKCRHCYLNPSYESDTKKYPHMKLETFKNVLNQGIQLGADSVKLTGGEPLMHEKVAEVIEYVNSKNLRLIIETNGTLCNKEISHIIAENHNPFVSVSLDSADELKHEWVRGVRGSFLKTIDGIKNLVNSGIKPQIIMSLMKHNLGRDFSGIIKIVEMAEELGAGSVKFNIVMPTERGAILHETGETIGIEELIEIGEFVENQLSSKAKIPIFYHHPPAFMPLNKIYNDVSCACSCGINGIIGVLSDGRYALCGIGESVPELTFGSADIEDLKSVWLKNLVLRELRHGLPDKLKGVCSICAMKNVCRGNCIAQNYYSARDLWAPFWYCNEAYKAGLFPKSRLTCIEQDL